MDSCSRSHLLERRIWTAKEALTAPGLLPHCPQSAQCVGYRYTCVIESGNQL